MDIYINYTVTVNTKDDVYEYQFYEPTADAAITKVIVFHPDWTSMVVVFTKSS